MTDLSPLVAAAFVLLLIGVIAVPLAAVVGRQRSLSKKESTELAAHGESQRGGISEILFKERDDSPFRVAWLIVVGLVMVLLGVWAPPSFFPAELVGEVDFGRTLRLVFIVGGIGNIALGGLRYVAARRRRRLDERDSSGRQPDGQ